MARDSKNLIVGLDIGTSKVVAMVAELLPDGRMDVIGMGGHESKGLKKGVVVNIEATVNAIQRALEEAELMADCKIERVYTGIAGSHIKSFNSTGMVAIKDKEVTPLDVDRAIETARAMPIPTDQQVLHILTQEFIIDGQDGVREPLGMSGVRLEVKVHIVTGAVSAAQNIVKCVRRCGLEVNDLILQPLASSLAVLTEDEKELGVCLVDIGGGTSDIAVFREGAIRHTAVVPIAGDQITNDIAMALRTPTPEAEELKVKHGCALRQLAESGQMIEVAGGGRQAAADADAADPRRGDRTPRRGTLFADPAGAARFGLRGTAVLGNRADRRLLDHAGHGRAGRGNLSHAGAVGDSPLFRRPLGRGPQPALRDGRGSAPRRRGAGAARAGRPAGRFIQASHGKDARMVPAQFLSASGIGDRQGGVPPCSTRTKDARMVSEKFLAVSSSRDRQAVVFLFHPGRR